MLWPILFALGALLVAAILVPVRSFRLRHVPGPPSLPILGNLLDVAKGASLFYEACSLKYGPIFKVWFGRGTYVVVTSPELAHIVGQLPERMHVEHIMSSADSELEVYGLTSARDAVWRTTRAAWRPAFHPASLTGYFSLMDRAALKLVSHLSRLADVGAPVDIWRELRSMTLAVNGSIAYGVDFTTMEDTVGLTVANTSGCSPPFKRHSDSQVSVSPRYGAQLLRACQVLFATSSVAKSGIWFKLNLMLPELNRFISFLAYLYPDKAFKAKMRARVALKRTSLDLLRASGTASAAAVTEPVDGEASVGIAEDSFLGTLLAQRQSELSGGLSDAQVLAQAITFLLAGYETTANALAFTIYSVAADPDVQARVLAEVDAFGREKDVTAADLDKYPYLTASLNESMRLYPPSPGMLRVSPVVMDLAGHRIPAHTTLLIATYALHRDPSVWPKPERFLPERFLEAEGPYSATMPGAYLPFGLGPRVCIGRHFAVREAIVTLVRLYQRYVFVLQPGQVPMALINGFNSDNTLTLAPKHGVRVIVQRR